MRRLVLLLWCVLPAVAVAQVRPGRPGGITRPTVRPPVQQRRMPGDTSKADSTKKDSTLYQWAPADSVMLELMNRPGYTVTRYEGQQVTFDALQRATEIIAAAAKSAAVKRGTQLMISDSTIAYSEKTKLVDVQAKKNAGTLVVSDSGSGQSDIVGHGRLTYNLERRTARISNAVFPVNNGQTWYVRSNVLQYVGDSANAKNAAFYGKGGTLTSCDDSIPDYHFEYGEVKRSATNTLVARPAVLYIRDVPIMWLPFMFQDTRGGRHSGILTPQFGLSDIIRNSPSYRRMVQNFGYYVALNDYMDVSLALDWRSSAGATNNDPGWMRYKGEWNYNWMDRFLRGHIATDYTTQSDGRGNLAVNWMHDQNFTKSSHLSTNINYVTSTDLQRQNALNPYAALATISSQVAYSDKYGPLSLSLGATQKQYPGRKQIDRNLPTMSLTSTPINIGGDWLVWTPNFTFSDSRTMNLDQPGPFSQRYFMNATGALDSSTVQRSSRTTATSFDTPLRIFGYDLRNSFRINDQVNDFPQKYTIYDVKTGAIVGDRIFASTYRTDVDWTPNFSLPPLHLFNVTPSVSLANVDPGAFWVRTERSGGQFVHQSKRVNVGVSASPTVYGFWPGFGPFSLLRHSLQPSIGWSWAPAAAVSDEYLKATGRTRFGYLGAIGQNMMSFGLNQNFEAKIRERAAPVDSSRKDTSAVKGGSSIGNQSDKIKLLSVSMSSFGYDFQRAAQDPLHRGWRSGFYIPTNERFNYSLRSDLLPGFDVNVDYSLFQGSTLSDTAKFKPYRERITSTFSIGQNNNPFAVLTRLFGRAVPEKEAPTPTTQQPNPQQTMEQQLANQPVAGMAAQRSQFIIPPNRGWQVSLSFTSSRTRPVTGSNVIEFDPKFRCAQYQAFNPIVYQSCIQSALTQPSTDTPTQPTIAGGPVYNIPATTSLQSNTQFDITEKWSASWNTTYDFERHQFASHMVTLQRDLHDWRAIFAFTQSPNGAFAFSFNIALKAEPDLKFNYNKATYRSGGTGVLP